MGRRPRARPRGAGWMNECVTLVSVGGAACSSPRRLLTGRPPPPGRETLERGDPRQGSLQTAPPRPLRARASRPGASRRQGSRTGRLGAPWEGQARKGRSTACRKGPRPGANGGGRTASPSRAGSWLKDAAGTRTRETDNLEAVCLTACHKDSHRWQLPTRRPGTAASGAVTDRRPRGGSGGRAVRASRSEMGHHMAVECSTRCTRCSGSSREQAAGFRCFRSLCSNCGRMCYR